MTELEAAEARISLLENLLGRAHQMIKFGGASGVSETAFMKEVAEALGWMSEEEIQAYVRIQIAAMKS